MEYLSPIWTGSAGSSLAKLDSVQAKAMKLIGKTEAAKLPLLSHRRAIAGLCALHRIVHNAAPVPVLTLCPPRASTRSRATRLSKPLFLVNPRVKRLTPSYWLNSFIPLMTVLWNSKLTYEIQSQTSLKKFKRLISPLQLLDHSMYTPHDLRMD
jgi:hypothetical protein